MITIAPINRPALPDVWLGQIAASSHGWDVSQWSDNNEMVDLCRVWLRLQGPNQFVESGCQSAMLEWTRYSPTLNDNPAVKQVISSVYRSSFRHEDGTNKKSFMCDRSHFFMHRTVI